MPEMIEMKLELVPIPVTDIERAKAFYADKIGFHLDHDVSPNEGVRIVQLTPVGSGCSILLSNGLGEISDMQPGIIKGLHLVVKDVAATRDLMISRGVAIGEIIAFPDGIKYCVFNDPDGNSWEFQEIPPGI